MQLDQFTKQVDRLKNTYGEKPYPAERVKILWEEMRPFDAQWFEEIVTEAIASLDRAPLSAYFAEKASKLRERSHHIAKHSAVGWEAPRDYRCDQCFDQGVFLALNKNFKSGPYAFRCHCPKGMADTRVQVPQFKQAHIDSGFYWLDPRKLREAMQGAE